MIPQPRSKTIKTTRPGQLSTIAARLGHTDHIGHGLSRYELGLPRLHKLDKTQWHHDPKVP